MGQPHSSKGGNTKFCDFDSNGCESSTRFNVFEASEFYPKCVFGHVCKRNIGTSSHFQELRQQEPHLARPQMPPKVIRMGLSSAGGPGSALSMPLSHSGLAATASFHASLAAARLSASSSCLLGASHVTVVRCSVGNPI